MSYQLSGADYDVLSGLVITQKVGEAAAFVEKLVQQELDKPKAVQPKQPSK